MTVDDMLAQAESLEETAEMYRARKQDGTAQWYLAKASNLRLRALCCITRGFTGE